MDAITTIMKYVNTNGRSPIPSIDDLRGLLSELQLQEVQKTPIACKDKPPEPDCFNRVFLWDSTNKVWSLSFADSVCPVHTHWMPTGLRIPKALEENGFNE